LCHNSLRPLLYRHESQSIATSAPILRADPKLPYGAEVEKKIQ